MPFDLTLAELEELLQWADNMYTHDAMTTPGIQLADRLWELYKEKKAQVN